MSEQNKKRVTKNQQPATLEQLNRLKVLGKLTIAGSIVETLLGVVYLVFVGKASFAFIFALSGALAGKIFHQGACIVYMTFVFVVFLVRILAMFLFPGPAIIITGCASVLLDIVALILALKLFEGIEPLTGREIKELARTQCACCSQSPSEDEL